jgi:hypothetical protein
MKQTDMRCDIVENNEPAIQVSVLLLCGIPGSGKSSLCRSISEHYAAEESSLHFHKILQIEYDAITSRLVVSGSQDKNQIFAEPDENLEKACLSSIELEAWRETRTVALNLLRDELLSAVQVRTNERDEMKPWPYRVLIIMDDNFHLRSMRRDVYKVCQRFVDRLLKENEKNDQDKNDVQNTTYTDSSMGIGMSTVFVNQSLEICINNNENRLGTANYISQRIITNMYQTMEVPDGKKHKFESCSIDTSAFGINAQSTNSHEFFLLLANTMSSSVLQHPILPRLPPAMTPEEIEKERLATLQSTMHQVDLILRAFVGATCRTNTKFGKVANAARKSIITEFKLDPFLIDKFYTDGKEIIKTEFEKKVLLDVSEEQCVEIKVALCKAMEDLQREHQYS